jgi:hypothetical protein
MCLLYIKILLSRHYITRKRGCPPKIAFVRQNRSGGTRKSIHPQVKIKLLFGIKKSLRGAARRDILLKTLV